MTSETNLLDLPVDILRLIFPYLDASSFLNLTATCTALHKGEFIYDSLHWSTLVRETFRVPNQPVVQNDGKRWQKLYKRLLTQSRIFTWGNNEKACLGHSYELPAGARPTRFRRMNALHRKHVSWPAEMQGTEGIGIVADVQCGGWSTSLLTAKGALYTVGVVDGLQFNPRRPPNMYTQTAVTSPTALRYPPGFAQPVERYDASTAVRQFSAGRAHVLGLTDSGRIWSWQNVHHSGLHVKFLQHETKEEGQVAGRGTIHKVVAGWNKSAALIEGAGIVLWEPLQRGDDETEIEDAALVLKSAVVPKTSLRRERGRRSRQVATDAGPSIDETVGEVQNFIVMEAVVVFNTDVGKVFVAQIYWDETAQRVGEPVELTLSATEDEDANFATDVQGSFHSFAVFTRSKEVLTSNQDRLMEILQPQQSQQPLFVRIPALQRRDVISVAFGDYHFHALHSSGNITSYGNEPQACGCLGLGGRGNPEGRLRGIRYQGMGGDGRLVPHAYTEGRRVWFEQAKQDWITFLTAGGADPGEASERIRMALGSPDIHCQGEVSEWVEQQGRDWESKFGLGGEGDDELAAYFALSVTAAGWHSGALVLVNEGLAAKVRVACEIPEPATAAAASAAADSDLLSQAASTALDYGRWFLGLPPYNVSSQSYERPANRPPQIGPANARTEQIHVPHDFGQSPRKGYKYVWAETHFPRLRLRDGTEMPGEVSFDEWRYGRPEFDLNVRW